MTNTVAEPLSSVGATIVLLNRDLFSAVGIVNTIRALGFEPLRVGTEKAFQHSLEDQSAPPVLGIVDMNGAVDWSLLETTLSQPEMPPVIAFGPHVDIEGRKAAKAAGVARLLSNGDFHREMAIMIERYARSPDS